MRFSTRWLLMATAYVALVIAAIATQSYFLADVVWAISLLTLSVAIVVACCAGNQRQAVALGFVLLAAAHILGQWLVPSRLPAMRLISAVGYTVFSSGEVFEPDPARPGAYRSVKWIVPAVRTVNAIDMLVAGLVGCVVGRMGYKLATRTAGENQQANSLH